RASVSNLTLNGDTSQRERFSSLGFIISFHSNATGKDNNLCGIAGIFSQTVGLTERELFEGLLMLNVYRGKDSTGVVRINELKKGVPYAQVKRAVVSSPGFVASKYGHDMLYDLDKKEAKDTSKTTGYIGHCRAATKGEIKVQNAHPFRFDHTIGVHNGTIHGSFKGSKDFETDSEALFN